MGVKTIFKVLLGTVVGMVLSMLLLELFNVSVVSYQLRQISRMAARQACILFTSETYKAGTNKGDSIVGGSYGLGDVVNCDGGLYVSGDFYQCGSADSTYAQRVWKKIYANDDFVDFCKKSEMQKYYAIRVLRIAAEAARDNRNITVPAVSWESSPDELANNVIMSTAQMYKNNYYTTANLGIPYMDENIVNRMYQWNLAQLLSNCNPASIQLDDSGIYCVNYRGFKVYADQSQIAGYDYKVYDLSPDPANSHRRDNEAQLWNDLNINANIYIDYLGYIGGTKGLVGHETELINGEMAYDDWYVTAVGINYDIVVNYEGITPLRNIISYVFNSQVAGLGDSAPNYAGMAGTSLGSHVRQINGGIDGNTETGVVTSGKLVYVLDR